MIRFLFFSLFLTCNSLSSQEYWSGNKSKLPSEFNYLLEALQKTEVTPAERSNFSSILKELDVEFSLMNKEELFLLIKGDIYKTLLNHYKGIPVFLLEEGQIELLNKAIEERGSKLNAFALWLMLAIKTDAQTLMSHPSRGQLGLDLKNKEVLRLKKKMTLIAPWIQNFLSMSVDEFHNELRPLLWDIFKKVETDSRLFVLMGRIEKSKEREGPLLFFSKSESKNKDDFPELDNWLRRQILTKEAEAVIKKESWKPKDEKYIPPKVLPKPIDDWMETSEWAALEKGLLSPPKIPKESESNPKKTLPKPVDDWILDDQR